MIINCKCGKYQFDVKKSELGTGNREVQCGICNLKWIHGNKSNSKNYLFTRFIFSFYNFFCCNNCTLFISKFLLFIICLHFRHII